MNTERLDSYLHSTVVFLSDNAIYALCFPRQMLLYSQEVGEDCTSNEEDLFIL